MLVIRYFLVSTNNYKISRHFAEDVARQISYVCDVNPYREAILEKEAALNAARQMRTELVVQAQELCIERVRASNMTCIIQAWTKLCTDKEEELVWLRNEVTRQVYEIRELREMWEALCIEVECNGRKWVWYLIIKRLFHRISIILSLY